jgi:hypothetical protein
MFRTKSEDKNFIGNLYVADRRNDETISTYFKNRKVTLVSDKWPQIIAQLVARNVKVYAITQMNTDKIGAITNVGHWRYNELKSFGIILTQEYNNKTKTTLNITPADSTTPQFLNTPPIFYHGIIITGNIAKGEIVADFLKTNKVDEVIYIDDQPQHVHNVAYACKRMQVPFTGFNFIAHDLMPGTPNHDIIALQKHYLLDKNIWLEDDEAEDILKHHHNAVPTDAAEPAL